MDDISGDEEPSEESKHNYRYSSNAASDISAFYRTKDVDGLRDAIINYYNKMYGEDVGSINDVNSGVLDIFGLFATIIDQEHIGRDDCESGLLTELTRGADNGKMKSFLREAAGYSPNLCQNHYDPRVEDEHFKNHSSNIAINYLLKELIIPEQTRATQFNTTLRKISPLARSIDYDMRN